MRRKPRNVHFLLSYDNPREERINGIIDAHTGGMTLKEYICTLVEGEEIGERLERIEKLLARIDAVTLKGNVKEAERYDELPDEETEYDEPDDETETVDRDVMDFLKGL